MKTMLIISILFVMTACSHVFYQPTKISYLNPEHFKLDYREYDFKSADGTNLHSWLIYADPTVPRKGLVVHFHGNAQNLSAHFMNMAWVTKQGFDLFIFDYRGYGKSGGGPTQEGVYHDALSAMEFGKNLFDQRKKSEKEKFIIVGQSLGGVISLRAVADFKDKDKVDLLVLDSTFMSYKQIGFDKLTDVWFLVPFSPLAYLLVSDKYAADDTLSQVTTPTLVIVGEKDRVVPSKFGKRIFKQSPALKKWIWKIENGQHIDGFHVDEGKYRKEFVELVEKL